MILRISRFTKLCDVSSLSSLITAGDGDQKHQMEEMSMSVIVVVGKSEEEKSLERLF